LTLLVLRRLVAYRFVVVISKLSVRFPVKCIQDSVIYNHEVKKTGSFV